VVDVVEHGHEIETLLNQIRKANLYTPNPKKVYAPRDSSTQVKLLVELVSQHVVVTCGEQTLAFAVLTSAIYNLIRTDRHRVEAVNWFCGGYHVGWCELLSLNSRWLVQLLMRVGMLKIEGEGTN
jgi:hypothetical protein